VARPSTIRLSRAWVLAVDPMEVFELDNQGLVETLARQYPFDRLQGSPAFQRLVELGQRVV
jgi:hypothetical protein